MKSVKPNQAGLVQREAEMLKRMKLILAVFFRTENTLSEKGLIPDQLCYRNGILGVCIYSQVCGQFFR